MADEHPAAHTRSRTDVFATLFGFFASRKEAFAFCDELRPPFEECNAICYPVNEGVLLHAEFSAKRREAD